MNLDRLVHLWDLPVVRAGVVLVLGLAVILLLAHRVRRVMLDQGRLHAALVGYKLITYLGVPFVVLWTARILQVDISALLATAGVVTVAIGFAAQTSLSNVIAGLFLLFDRPFEVGQAVSIDGHSGVVEEIRPMSTFLRTWDNVLVRFPNEFVLKATILNHADLPARRVEIRVGVAYSSELASARSTLVEAVQGLPLVLFEPPAEVLTVAFGDSAVELEVRAWVDRTQFLAARTAIIERIHETLRAEGVEIPFPQLTISKAGEAATPQEGR